MPFLKNTAPHFELFTKATCICTFGFSQEKLNELDTENIEPLTSVAEITLKLRSDEVKSENIREQILKNSPDENEDFFVVPRVVE